MKSEISKITKIYKKLKKYKNLSPNKNVNKTFCELVDICSNACSFKSCFLLNHKNIKEIQKPLNRICSIGEYCLEKYWANKFLNEKEINIQDFVYYQNYVDLSFEEYNYFNKNNFDKKVLFIGSGPLPMTAIILTKKYGLSIDCIDTNPESIEIASSLIKKINLDDKIKFINIDVLDMEGFENYGNIILAALVGDTTTSKNEIINHIISHLKDFSRLIIRSSNDLKKLLYPEVDKENLKTKFVYVVPENKRIINSFLVCGDMV